MNKTPPRHVPWDEKLVSHVQYMIRTYGTRHDTKALDKHHLERCLKVFQYIHGKIHGNTHEKAYIPYKELKAVSSKYKEALRDLYNCNIIYYSEGRGGRISHGLSTSTFKQFCGCYSFSRFLLKKDESFNQNTRSHRDYGNGFYRPVDHENSLLENIEKYKPLLEKMLENPIPNSLTSKEAMALKRRVLKRQESLRHGNMLFKPQYTLLHFDDGTPFNCPPPRHGKYEKGRVYNKLSCLKKEKRKHLMYMGTPLTEVGDVKSCFMKIVASLSNDPALIYEVTSSDIYSDCVLQMHLTCSRNEVKPYFQKYILASPKDLKSSMRRKTSKNNPSIMKAVYSYMENNFPMAHQYVISSPLTESPSFDGKLRLKRKKVKQLVQTLQETEASLISSISSMCEGTTFTIHDSVLSDKKQNFDFQKEVNSMLFRQTSSYEPSLQLFNSVMSFTNQNFKLSLQNTILKEKSSVMELVHSLKKQSTMQYMRV